MKLVWGTVEKVAANAQDVQRLGVALDDGTRGTAVNYVRLAGVCGPDERVLLNTTAVGLELGTGGSHFVVARLGDARGVALDAPSGGHIMKLRYAPHQVDVVSVESPESPHYDAMREATSLDGMPVVCCGLHSQVPLVAAAVKHLSSETRVSYCMTDQAALVLPLSEVVAGAVDAGLIDTTITCGQAFGGEYEAVNLHSGLLAARHVAHADVAIVAIGPGVVGTGTVFGHGGIAQGEAINAAGVIGGVPIACLRVSFADGRERHRTVSHHTLAALAKIALLPALVPIPALPAELRDQVVAALDAAGIFTRHVQVDAESTGGEPPSLRGVTVTSMGRGIADDPAFFAAAFAAGEVAAQRVVRGHQR
jgi:hypothetical protein